MRSLSFKGEWLAQGLATVSTSRDPMTSSACIHTLILQDGNRKTRTFWQWDREYTKPNHLQKRLLDVWKHERSWEKCESDKWCVRSHRTTKEGQTSNGTVKPVFELSDPPRRVPRNSGPRKTSYRMRPRGDPILFPT